MARLIAGLSVDMLPPVQAPGAAVPYAAEALPAGGLGAGSSRPPAASASPRCPSGPPRRGRSRRGPSDPSGRAAAGPVRGHRRPLPRSSLPGRRGRRPGPPQWTQRRARGARQRGGGSRARRAPPRSSPRSRPTLAPRPFRARSRARSESSQAFFRVRAAGPRFPPRSPGPLSQGPGLASADDYLHAA